METDPVHNPPDAADDPAIWIHPTDPALSVVIGTDKKEPVTPGGPPVGGLVVYDLAGRELSFNQDGSLNNVHVAYNFPYQGSTVSLVAATNRLERTVDLYRVEVPTRALVKIGSFRVTAAIKKPRGICVYHSPVTGRFYVFVTDEGYTDQYEVGSTLSGTIKGSVVRQWKLASGPLNTEGLVADNEASASSTSRRSRRAASSPTVPSRRTRRPAAGSTAAPPTRRPATWSRQPRACRSTTGATTRATCWRSVRAATR